MSASAERSLPDPKRIQRWARRVCVGLALVGFVYLWARFSITGAPPNLVRWPYKGAPLIVDEWPGWGRALEQDDLVFYNFPGEAKPRPVAVVGLPGQRVQVRGDELLVGTRVYPGAAGPRLEGLAQVPAGTLVLVNHDPAAPHPDSRTHGPLPASGIASRVVWYYPKKDGGQ